MKASGSKNLAGEASYEDELFYLRLSNMTACLTSEELVEGDKKGACTSVVQSFGKPTYSVHYISSVSPISRNVLL